MADVERTEDGRYIVVAGRRWRASDPAIPERLRQELVNELMSARRAVRSGAGDETAVAAARVRVQNAKVALGERGEPWWEPATEAGRANRIKAAVSALLTKRGAGSSICPSDAARIAASPEWRPAMAVVYTVATELASEGIIRITQGDEDVTDLDSVAGPIRLRLPLGQS